MDEIGPVDYAVIASPGNQCNGDIAPALADLVEAGTIRLIDAAFVSKDEKGDVSAIEVTELAPDVRDRLDALNLEVQGLVNEQELEAIGQELELDSSAALLVWENVWARDVAHKMRNAGGVLVAFERVPHDVVQAAREWALEEAKT
jgi:Family of unknown function (DUF6325)